jgi:OOP family OmpA-OmpF porin
VTNTDGTIAYSGVVPDEATRNAIVAELSRVFGSDRVSGSLITDPRVGPATWLERLSSALALLKMPGAQALFSGNALSVGGFIPDNERTAIIDKLKERFGKDMVVGPLTDAFVNAVKAASQKTINALGALPAGFGPKEVVDALNLSIINFASGSAAVPGYNRLILEKAAAVMRQLPAGTVIEVVGHTDATGDEPANLRLSQERAEAVRSVLISFGVDPLMIKAQGRGSSKPVASNDTPEGRFQNRRIEYVVVH